MNTATEIKRALEALDQTFASPANSKSGKLKFDEWSARRAELVEKLRYAEHVESTAPAPRAAPALTMQQLNSIFQPPDVPAIPSADRAELDAANRGFTEAVRDLKVGPARDIVKNPRRIALSQSASVAHTARTLRTAYDQTGVKLFSAMIVGAISALRNELSETRLELRIAHAHLERLERAYSTLRGKATR
ncbi:MAG: hypothetical protein HY661_02455 [Betaproteobacteria bacterium]|nr:hypothetical protein [Betaproteobacteria bacterium]